MFATWDGTTSTNSYLSPHSSNLELSHPALSNVLILAEHDESPYQYFPAGWKQADGRSLLGAIRLKGGNWLKGVWLCNFLATGEQCDLFDALLSEQQDSNQSVALIDRWVEGVTLNKTVWLQVDRQYKTVVEGTPWWRLQFEMWEV